MKWLIIVVKIAKLISMHAIRLATRASKYASRTLSSTILNMKVFIFKTGPEFIPWLTSKISSFSPSNEFTKPVRSKKYPFWRAISKTYGFGVRIHWFRVDGSPIRINTYAVSRIFGFVWTGL